MGRAELMRSANKIIRYLSLFCNDGEFADRILDAISSGCEFTEEEIREECLSGCFGDGYVE